MDIKLIIGFAIVIAMAMLHFGIQIYRALKKENPGSNNQIYLEKLTRVEEGVKNLGKNFMEYKDDNNKNFTEYKEDNNKAHDRIFNLINKILLKKGG